MLRKNIQYTDFNGQKRTDMFYFNLTKAELAEMELSERQGLSTVAQQIIDAEDTKEILAIFKMIVRASVGKKSEDGRRFIKNEDIISELFDSNAYSELFMELVQDADAAAKFIRGVVPEDLTAASEDGEDPREIEIQRLRRELARTQNNSQAD